MPKQTDNPNVYHCAKNISAYWFLLHLELWRISKYKECVRTNISFKVHFMDMESGEQKEKCQICAICLSQCAEVRQQWSQITCHDDGYFLQHQSTLTHIGNIFYQNHLIVPSSRKQFSKTMHFKLLANNLFSNKNFQGYNLWGNNTLYYALF